MAYLLLRPGSSHDLTLKVVTVVPAVIVGVMTVGYLGESQANRRLPDIGVIRTLAFDTRTTNRGGLIGNED